jgi:hypothetical protein
MPMNVSGGYPHRIEIQEIADNNLRPPLAESLGPVVLAMHESANTFPSIEELRCRGAAGRAGGSRNEEAGIRHLVDSTLLSSKLDVV